VIEHRNVSSSMFSCDCLSSCVNHIQYDFVTCGSCVLLKICITVTVR